MIYKVTNSEIEGQHPLKEIMPLKLVKHRVLWAVIYLFIRFYYHLAHVSSLLYFLNGVNNFTSISYFNHAMKL